MAQRLNVMNGDHWRIITPILLSCLSILVTMAIFIQQGVREDISWLRQEVLSLSQFVTSHIASPGLHSRPESTMGSKHVERR